LTIVRGTTSRDKVLALSGLDRSDVDAWLRRLAGEEA